MILFYKTDPKNYEVEFSMLNRNFPGEVSFGDAFSAQHRVILVDNHETLAEVLGTNRFSRVVLACQDKAVYDISSAMEMAHKGVFSLVQEGDLDEIVDVVGKAYHARNAITTQNLTTSNIITIDKTHRVEIPGLINNHFVGTSPHTVKTLERIARFLNYREDILIEGQNGTGKDVVVRTIFDNLNTTTKGSINAAQFSAELFISELCGYKKGAFTGADEDREGLLSSYNGGYLFIDEIGELSMENQAKLLRIVQNREYQRVGDIQVRTFDVRFIFATNRNLALAAQTGKFREDLYHRISPLRIELRPLSERAMDIPFLVENTLDALNKKYPEKSKTIAPEVMEVLTWQKWKGNVRELNNILLQMFVLSDGPAIDMPFLHSFVMDERSINIERPLTMGERIEKRIAEKEHGIASDQAHSQSAGKSKGI